jgi:hypothetical protein
MAMDEALGEVRAAVSRDTAVESCAGNVEAVAMVPGAGPRRRRRRRRRKGKKGEGASYTELLEVAKRGMVDLEEALQGGRGARGRASTALTEVYVHLQDIGRRIAGEAGKWLDGDGGGPGAGSQEAEEEKGPREVEAPGMSMAELLAGPPEHVEELLGEQLDRVVKQVEDYEEIAVTIEAVRLHHFRAFIDYLVSGCRTPDEVMRKVLAITRRARPESMEKLGLTQSDVARRLGEKRATVQAREKRVVEKPLKEQGARGYKLLGGVKGEEQRENCRLAQLGNQNRKGLPRS